MKDIQRKAGKLLGISLVAYLSTMGATANATSQGPIYGTLSLGGSLDLLNSSKAFIKVQPGKPLASQSDATVTANTPVTAQFNVKGIAQYTIPQSSSGTFRNNGFSNSVAHAAFGNLNFLDSSSISDIRNQVVLTGPQGNTLSGGYFIIVKNNGSEFDFKLNQLVANTATKIANGESRAKGSALFSLLGTGILSGHDANGNYVSEKATFTLTSVQQTGPNFSFSASLKAVPIPAALLFVGPALAGVFGWSRRKAIAGLSA